MKGKSRATVSFDRLFPNGMQWLDCVPDIQTQTIFIIISSNMNAHRTIVEHRKMVVEDRN